MSEKVMAELMAELAQKPVVHVSQGRMVRTLGPWSNGHEEQAAIVTHVYGSGLPGCVVNLHVFVDLAQPLICEEVPWYPSRAHAEQALAADAEKANIIGGAVVCYYPDRD